MSDDIPFLTIHEAGLDGFRVSIDTRPTMVAVQPTPDPDANASAWGIAVNGLLGFALLLTPGGAPLGVALLLGTAAYGLWRGAQGTMQGVMAVDGPLSGEVTVALAGGQIRFGGDTKPGSIPSTDVRLVVTAPASGGQVELRVITHTGRAHSLFVPADRRAAVAWVQDALVAATDGLRDEQDGEVPEAVRRLMDGRTQE